MKTLSRAGADQLAGLNRALSINRPSLLIYHCSIPIQLGKCREVLLVVSTAGLAASTLNSGDTDDIDIDVGVGAGRTGSLAPVPVSEKCPMGTQLVNSPAARDRLRDAGAVLP